MNVVGVGNQYRIFGENIQTYKILPVKYYDVVAIPMQGFFLVERSDLVVDEKVYGSHEAKIEKVIGAYKEMSRNLGIILSGKKGIGKSLFARMLANKAIASGYPVLVVSQYIPGIANFISSIEQEVVIIFDEFEKTFSNCRSDEDGTKPQEEMLSLFDGIDAGKKLFVITCNDVYNLNEFLVNRPGRFHYHFTITTPNHEEVSLYMKEKLKPQYHSIIPEVAKFSSLVQLTYDCLRAIAFELNRGYGLNETLRDLNITKVEDSRFTIEIQLSNGEYLKETECHVDLFESKKPCCIRVYSAFFAASIEFVPKDAIVEIKGDTVYLDNTAVKLKISPRDIEEEDEVKTIKALTIKKIMLHRETFSVERYAV